MIWKELMKDSPNNHPKKIFDALASFLVRSDLQIRLLLFPLVLLGILIILTLIDNNLQTQSQSLKLRNINSGQSWTDYPSLIYNFQPTISAVSAIIMDANSHKILYQKNPYVHASMASTTKLMTALVGLDYYKSDDILTIKRNYVEGSGLHFFAGEQFRFIDLLYAMFLPSANDAAMALADNYPGGEKVFVAAMNAKAKALHLANTAYEDPAGLDDPGDYTTVGNLAELADIVYHQPLLHKIFGTKNWYIMTVDKKYGYPLTNLNQLLGQDGVVGIKTGTTEEAGQVLITAKQNGSHAYIIIVMDSINRFADTLTLLHLIDNNVRYTTEPEMESGLLARYQ